MFSEAIGDAVDSEKYEKYDDDEKSSEKDV